jgi:predicted transcriptional regulator
MLASTGEAAGRALDALGNPTRREILGLLRERPLTVGVISRRLPISRPAVSRHLRILQEAGLVAHRAEGRRNVFYLQPAGFREARLYLALFWDEALAEFKRFLEQEDPPER